MPSIIIFSIVSPIESYSCDGLTLTVVCLLQEHTQKTLGRKLKHAQYHGVGRVEELNFVSQDIGAKCCAHIQ